MLFVKERMKFMSNPIDLISIEVVYIDETVQWKKKFNVPSVSSVEFALSESSVFAEFPNLNLQNISVGIFSHLAKLSDLVHMDDRVEIYQSLQADPKQTRRKRAKVSKI